MLLFSLAAFAQEKHTFLFAEKDTNKLYLDVYVPETQNDSSAIIIFAFGGGYIGGARDDNQIKSIKDYFTKKGFVVISIDYRLGLKNVNNYSIVSGIKKYEKAVFMAAEDMISALAFTVNELPEKGLCKINPNKIIVMGSSAGAITALQTDYALCNNYLNSSILPDWFRLAGVVSYSGGIFSKKGTPKYKNHPPAPTLFCHGTKDKLVPYKKIQFFNLGMFGSVPLAKQFKKNGYGYHFRRYVGIGHQVAMTYPSELDIVDDFISDFVFNQPNVQIDETYYNPNVEDKYLKIKIRDLKKFK